MLPVIGQLLEAEKEAGRIVASARAEAADRLRHASVRAAEETAHTAAETRHHCDRLVEEAVADATRQKESRLAETIRNLDQAFHLDSAQHQALIAAAMRCLTATTHES